MFAFELAWRGGEGSKCLVSYFKEEQNNAGEVTGRVVYDPLFSKTTQGGEKPCASKKWLIKNKSNPDICPVRLYKKFLEKRKGNDSIRFFLTVNPNWKLNRKWYKNIPIGRNTMSKWTLNQASIAGLNTNAIKISNHSLRATAVSSLAKRGVGEEQLIKITGHSNTKSIQPYLQMDETHHQEIIEKMRNNTEPQDDNASAVAFSTSTINAPVNAAPNQTRNFYNCVFHCSSCNF